MNKKTISKKTIQEAVAEKIVGCGSTVMETVVSKIAQIEIDKRIELITKSVAKVESLNKDLTKIERNDIVTYTDSVKSESMSKDRYEQIQKLKQTIGELEKDITDCLENNSQDSYNKLSDKMKKLDGGNKETSSDDSKK